MDLETLSHIIRELSRKITDRRDERALEEMIDLILDLRDNERAIKLIAQLIHDEKTYVLSDTEILTGEERRLIDIAALYHALYMLCRALPSKDRRELDIEQRLIESLYDKNISDTTLILEESIRRVLHGNEDERQRTIRTIDNVLNKLEVEEKDLRTYLMISIVAETRKLIDKILERVHT
ncbi:MAG: hypothetical protein GXO10_03340 [Crenarchaeota archaeon]|nr:hypothetical protein [Thermoproteota archaeon]